jgi:membrane-associated phospholipid phosphatase
MHSDPHPDPHPDPHANPHRHPRPQPQPYSLAPPDNRSAWTWLPPAVALLLIAMLAVTDANRSLFLLLNQFGHQLGATLGDTLWLNLTLLGDGAVVLALVLPSIRRSPRCFWAALIAAVFAALWVQVLKQVVVMPRPLGVLPPEMFFQSGPGFRAVSFPSGHAAAIFAIVGIWVMSSPGHTLIRTAIRGALLALAVLVSLSRVMVGVHWPVDILWGMLGGWLAAWSGLSLYARYRWKTACAGGLLAGLVLLLVAAALLVSHHVRIPEVMPLQRLLGVICLVWGGCEIFLMLPRMSHAKGELKGEFDGQK